MYRFYLYIYLTLIFVNINLAQSYLGYYFIPTEYGLYSQISGGTISSATGNDGAENINLPFPFKYMGVTYTTARISVNGWLEMGQTYTGPGAWNELESTIKKPLICPLWADLYADSESEIRYETIGAYPAQYFVVQWKNILLPSYERKSFQVRLWELDGTIDFIYGPGPTYQTFFDNFSIGMNNHIGGPGNFISVTLVNNYYFTVDTMVANNSNNDLSLLTEGMLFSFVPTYSGGRKAFVYQTPDTVIAGNPNQKIFAIILTCHAGGVLTPPWVTKFNFNTNGTTNTSDIQNAKLFYTGSYPYFSTNVQKGPTYPNPDGVFEIGGFSDYLNNNGLSYYWLAYDISSNATVGNHVDADCFRIDFDGCCPPLIPDTTFASSYCIISNTGVQGNFTVGNGEDYENLFEVFNFLESNILIGPVTLQLTNNYNPNSEVYPILIPDIVNSSANNTVTINTISQNEIVFQSDTWTIFHFKESEYVIIDGYNQNSGQNNIKIINNSSSGSAAYFSDGSSFNIIQNCELQASDTSSEGSVVFFHETPNTLSPQGNQILNCVISKNETGDVKNGILYKRGTPVQYDQVLSEQPEELIIIPNVIKGCIIKDFTFRGISIENNVNSFHLTGNSIFQTSESTSPIVEGIYFQYGAYPPENPNIIEGNKIYNLQPKNVAGNSVTGIRIPGGFCTNTFNNFISLEGNEFSTVMGIIFASYGYYSIIKIYYNSILIRGSNFSDSISAAFCRLGYTNYTEFKNNILINKRTGGNSNSKNYCIYLDNDYLIPDLDYNNYYYSSGSNNYLGALEGNNASTLQEWNALTSRDFNSSFTDVAFVSDIDLHLTGSSLGNSLLIAIPISGITTDIDGEIRNPQFPYKGADENLEYPLPVEFLLLSASLFKNNINLTWITASEVNNRGFEIEKLKDYKIATLRDWEVIGFVNGNGTTTETKFYSFIDENLSPGKYQYRLKQIDFDGTFEYSDIVEVEVGVPDNFALFQNYPNPFNPTTKISWQSPVGSWQTLKVYDLLGREVAVLVNEERPAGYYEVEFDGSNLSSGIYFYSLRNGDFIQTKKLILMK